MDHGFLLNLRTTVVHISQRCVHLTLDGKHLSTSPKIPRLVQICPIQGAHQHASSLRHKRFRFRLHSSSSPRSQNDRNSPSLRSLVFPRHFSIHCNVYEGKQVQQALKAPTELPNPLELPPPPQRFRPIRPRPSPPSLSRNPPRLHARRPDVLLSSPDPRPLLPLPEGVSPLRFPNHSSRGRLHRSVTQPVPVPVSILGPGPSVLPGVQPLSPVHSTPIFPRVVEDHRDPQLHSSRPVIIRHGAGILGPHPLSSNLPTHKRISNPGLRRQTAVQDSGLRSTPSTPLIERALSGPPGSGSGLPQPVFVCPSCSNASCHRSLWVHPHAKLEARICMGHLQCLGSSGTIHAPHLSDPAKFALCLSRNPSVATSPPAKDPLPLFTELSDPGRALFVPLPWAFGSSALFVHHHPDFPLPKSPACLDNPTPEQCQAARLDPAGRLVSKPVALFCSTKTLTAIPSSSNL
ncbi:p50 [Fig fleck-associated virus]|uniref:p50 n=1 Tax=Fig fleck-associated virus TaxID=548908 RepID=UPI00020168D1|nr:p50 [Fig fleck-associated virus]CCA41205.1 p50 [Fig fleck-associated virus]